MTHLVLWLPVASKLQEGHHRTAGLEPRSPALGRWFQGGKPWLGSPGTPEGLWGHPPQTGLSCVLGDPGKQLGQLLHFVYRKIKERKGMEVVKFDLTSPRPALVLDFASHEKLQIFYDVCLVLVISLHQQDSCKRRRSHDFTIYTCNYLYINALLCKLMNMI